MLKSEKRSCFTIFILFNISATLAANYRSKANKAVAVNGTIITTRFGEDGSAKEQCQCITFWQCDADKVYDDPTNPKPCGDPDLACCKLPFFYLSESTEKPEETSLSSDIVKCSKGVCVDASECNNYGAGKLDFSIRAYHRQQYYSQTCPIVRNGESTVNRYTGQQYGHANGTVSEEFSSISSCTESKVCCPTSDLIKKETTDFVKLPDKLITETSGSELQEDDCVCVAHARCVNYGQGILQMRLSKCGEGDICCPKSDIIVPSEPMATPSLPSKYECGFKKGDPLAVRIANSDSNDNTEFGEFPWMSLILKKNGDQEEVVCGASLLDKDLLLTAAHCVHKLDKESLIIRVGEHDTYLPPELESAPHEDGYVADIYIPNNYRADVAFNDLALIKVKQPFKFRENVVPICSPVLNPEYGKAEIYDPSRCVATGWGKDAYSKTAKYSKVLKKVDLVIVPNEQCQHALRNTRLGATFKLHESFICAGGQAGKDTCKGDGGGPLICAMKSDPTRYVQVGVTSWGIDCAKNYPGVYASVMYNKNWLRTEPALHSIFDKR